MQGNHKIKKFTHNRMKACIERNENEDKENRVYPSGFCNKKLSVELPYKHSESYEIDHHKSIFNQQISVTLNTSNHRPNYEKDQLSLDIKSLTHLLAKQTRDSLPLREILNQEINDVKSIEVRLLINRMIDKLIKQGNQPSTSSMMSEKESHVLVTESLVKPIIEKQLEVLEKNYEMLQQRYEIVKKIKDSTQEDKLKMLNRMREVERAQQCELSEVQHYA